MYIRVYTVHLAILQVEFEELNLTYKISARASNLSIYEDINSNKKSGSPRFSLSIFWDQHFILQKKFNMTIKQQNSCGNLYKLQKGVESLLTQKL